MTWFWATCRSLSLSGTGRIPCAGSGEKRGGAPTQDSPANPWDCGLARDHFLNQSCRVREKRESTRVLDEFHFCRFLLPPFLFHSVDKHYRDNPEYPDTSDDAAQPLAVFLSFFFFFGVKVEESDVTLCGMNACSCNSVVQLDWQAATGFLQELHFTDMSLLREHCV